MYIKSLNIGMPETINTGNYTLISAIRKMPCTSQLKLGEMGLDGDGTYESAHGGKDKALHVFSFENYAFFEKCAGQKLTIPTFGENITMTDYDEEQARVGDILQIGTAVVQVSEPTIRCNKIGLSAGLPQMLKWIQDQLKTGFYMRVLQPGEICVSSTVTLSERGPEMGLISHLNRAMFHFPEKQDVVLPILEIPELSSGWKERLRKRHNAKC